MSRPCHGRQKINKYKIALRHTPQGYFDTGYLFAEIAL